MKKIFLIVLVYLITVPSTVLGNDLKTIIKKHHFNESSLGLVIQENEKNIFSLNPLKLMIPASLTKIITAGAILNALPLNKKFSTELFYTPQKDICLKGGGDPSFVSEKMWYLVNEFKRSEIKNVKDIIIDSSRFDQELYDQGRDSIRVDRAFDAPISATSFNWNSVNIYIRPGLKRGDVARVFVDPENDYIVLENKTKTEKKGSAKSINVSRVTTANQDRIIVTGSIPEESEEMVVYKSITNPNQWTAAHLKQFLSQRGISVLGTSKMGICPLDSTLVGTVQSKNLNEMISDMLKFSNNFVAEMLAKNLAAEMKSGQPAMMKDGIEEIKKYMDGLEIKRTDYVLENVSGLTRGNQMSATQLVQVLSSIRNNFLIFPEFLSGLPIAGVDGTLKNRMKNSEGESVVRAKTGYLDGVVGLAGYVGRKNKPPLVFVFMFNGSFEQGLAARPLFDDLINHLKSL